MMKYTITEHVTAGQRTRTVYTFTQDGGDYSIYEAFEPNATDNGRRKVTVSVNMQPPGVRTSQKHLAEVRGRAHFQSYTRIVDGQIEEASMTQALEAGLITQEDYFGVNQPVEPVAPAEHDAPTLAAVPMADPEPALPEPEPQPGEVSVERDCLPTVTVTTTKGDLTANVPHIGGGRFAVDYGSQQVATIDPGLHYSTVKMNATREEFTARTPDGAAWLALARHLSARGYCVPDLA